MKYIKYAVVLLSGCIITEALKHQFKVGVGEIPFAREFAGMWLGPMLTGWSFGWMMAMEAKVNKN